MFMGEYNHSIDAKGRVIIPAKFREQLTGSFVVTSGLDGCLFGYGQEAWERMERYLSSLPMTNRDARKFTRYILGNAATCEFDKQGRVLIPQKLREAAGITTDVVLAGTGDRFEIWSPERWAEAASYDDIEEIAEKLEEIGRGAD